MTNQTGVDWPTCSEDGCIGVQLARIGQCLAHATTRRRNAALKRFAETGGIDARGVPVTNALLREILRILRSARRDAEDQPTFPAACFQRATFHGDADFGGATFQGTAHFGGATFNGDAWFVGATFQGAAQFGRATFHGDAWFVGTTFQGTAHFGGATFQGYTEFKRALFQRDAEFPEATFHAAGGFGGARFHAAAEFNMARFQGANLRGATFHGTAEFNAVDIQVEAFFAAATFHAAAEFTSARLGHARFHGAIVRRDADLSSPSLLTGILTLSDARLAHREQRLVQAVRRLAPAATADWSERPRLLSVQGANLAGLGVANVDLTQCRFAGAHNLDKLRFEAEVSLAAAPVRLPWDWRQVLAEERASRAAQARRWSNRWAAADWWPAWLHQPYRTQWPGMVVEPAQLAGLYRALRKVVRMPRTSRARPTSTTARWRCAATPAAAAPVGHRRGGSSVGC